MKEPLQKDRKADEMPPRLTWDTSSVPRQERFSYFREGVCQAFMSISPEKPADSEIDARLETVQLPQGCVSTIDVTPHRVLRTKSDIATIPDDCLSLGLQVTGGLQGNLHRGQYTQKPGDVFLVEANAIERLELNKSGRFDVTVMIFPKALLTTAPRFEGFQTFDGPAHSALKGCLTLLRDRCKTASQAELASLFDASFSLMQAEIVKDRDYLEDCCAKEKAVRTGILQAIKDFVARHISDPSLSTPSVAAHFGISARYVQKLFAGDGTTFKSYVMAARLDHVRSDLLDRSVAHTPPGDIAFRWGFRDMSTFHRTFKHRFGDTPGQMRAAARHRWLSF